MGDHLKNKLFKAFVIFVILAHGFQLVWNHPLLAETTHIDPGPFHQSEDTFGLIPDEWRSRRTSGFTRAATSDSDSDIFNEDSLSEYNKRESLGDGKEILQDSHRRTPHRRSAGDIGSLCSIFQTFLDARFAHCRVSNQQQEDDHRRHDDSIDESNDLSLTRDPSSQHPEDMMEHLERRPPPPPPVRADKRIDHDITSDEEDEQDETKISQDRTMIVVPDRPCPKNKRRDPRGYCRRVVTIRTNYPFGPPQSLRPIRYYYSRFVAVPTLHFILPNLK